MESSSILKIREHFIRNILILLLLPLFTFFLIFISFGNEFHQYLSKNPKMYCLYELSTLRETVSQSAIPAHISSIAFDMVIYSYVLFSIWLILFAYSSYQKLKLRKHNFLLTIIEFIVLAFGYCFIVSPGLSVYIQILGWLLFLLFAIVITVYVLFYNRMKHEKE